MRAEVEVDQETGGAVLITAQSEGMNLDDSADGVGAQAMLGSELPSTFGTDDGNDIDGMDPAPTQTDDVSAINNESALLGRTNGTLFEDCRQYFRLKDTKKEVDSTITLKFKGLAGLVSQGHAFNALQILLQPTNGIWDQFLADNMGSPAATVYLLAAIIFQANNHRWNDIHESRDAEDNRHNGLMVTTQCPSAYDDYPWQCPCEHGGVASRLPQRQSDFTLFVVPPYRVTCLLEAYCRLVGTSSSIFISPSDRFRTRIAVGQSIPEGVDLRKADGQMESVSFDSARDVLRNWRPTNLDEIEAARVDWWISAKDAPQPSAPQFPAPILPSNAGDIFIITTPMDLEPHVLRYLTSKGTGYICTSKTECGDTYSTDPSVIRWYLFQFIVIDDWHESEVTDPFLDDFILYHAAQGMNAPHIWLMGP